MFDDVRRTLSERFGGFTAFTRAPAQGLWKGESKTHHDEIVVFEVMAERLDDDWWRGFIARHWRRHSARTRS